MQENTSTQPEPQGNEFLKQLRAATGPMHTALEANPVSASLMSPDVTRDAYARYLVLMSEVIGFTEKAIFPSVADIVPDIERRRKLAQIHDDIRALHSDAAVQPDVFSPVNESFSVPFALGYMYVVEGSTLGGRYILKHIQARLGIEEQEAGKFFAGYGADTGAYWKSFLSALTQYAETSGQEQEIIKGAQHAFAAIDHYFAAHNVPA